MEHEDVVVEGEKFDFLDFSKMIWSFKMKVEMLIICIIPIPFYDFYVPQIINETEFYYLFSELMFSLMFLRFYFIFSTALSYGEYSDAFSIKLCKAYHFESDIRFNLKCMYL